jgi:hypothetical protein
MKILELTGLSEPLFLLLCTIVLPLAFIFFLYFNERQEKAIAVAQVSVEDEVVDTTQAHAGIRRRH